jgi:hypothetical protein
MAAKQEKTSKIPIDDETDETGPRDVKIDRTARAGSENSLGAQSVRDGRPATDDSVVEAMDEEDQAFLPLTRGERAIENCRDDNSVAGSISRFSWKRRILTSDRIVTRSSLRGHGLLQRLRHVVDGSLLA